MDPLLRDAADRSARYLATLPERRVFPTKDSIARLSELDKLPEGPTSPEETLRLLDDVGSPATVASAGPRYHGFVVGGALPATVAAHWLATAWDNTAWSRASSPTGAALDEIALRWTADVLGFDARTMGGALVTGATMANLCGLAAARHRVLAAQGWDVERDGLFGAPPVRVVVGAEAHPTLHKALGILGLGRERVERVPVDDQGRMRADALPELDASTLLCLQAGNVNSGAFDPIAPLVERAHAAGAWTHVDGAFGAWAAASPKLRHLSAGMERADSVATDAHKWLNVPYDCGILLTRHAEDLRAAMRITAAYLPAGAQREPGEFTPDSSRRMRGADVWAALHSLGRTGVADMVERNCAQARRYAAGLREAGFDVLNDVVLNQVVARYQDDAGTRRVLEAVQEEGVVWCGPTTWRGVNAFRVSVSSWATTEADVDRGIASFARAAAAAAGAA